MTAPTTVITDRFDRARRARRRLRDLATQLGRRRVPIHRGESFAPFFIVGSGRSGTTLTRRILGGLTGLRIPAEAIDLGAILHAVRRDRAASWRDLIWLVLGAFATHGESDVLDLDLPALAHRLEALPPARHSLACIVDAVYRNGDDTITRWGDKTVLNTLAMPECLEVFPDAQFLHLLRDGVDVAYSCVQAGRYQTIDEGALRWRNAVRSARRFARRHPDRILEVRFEQLVDEPSAVASRICRFLRLPYDDALLRVPTDYDAARDVQKHWRFHATTAQPITADRIGRGRRALDASERRRIDRYIGADLERMGYERAA